jgi:hypothetical protein
MYARRQRRVQSAGTNARFTGIMPNPDVILDRTPWILYSYKVRHPYQWVPLYGMPRWRSGHAADCRSATLRFKSGPWLTTGRSSERPVVEKIGVSQSSTDRIISVVIAAIAVGKHLDPFRTQQLSRLTWYAVLRYASPRETYFAAITFLLKAFFSESFPSLVNQGSLQNHNHP